MASHAMLEKSASEATLTDDAPAGPPVDRHAMLHAVFMAMDADGGGTVDSEEFMSMFSDSEVKHAKRFLKEIDNVRSGGEGDGQLSSTEFCDFMVEYTKQMPEKDFKQRIARWMANLAGSPRKLKLRKVFSSMDVDHSGSVSLEEFRALVSDSTGAPDANFLHGAADVADLFRRIEGAEGNGDGELTVDEWVPFVLAQEAGRTEQRFDELVEAMAAKLARKRRETLLRAVFMRMDADSSGSVDRAEFEHLKDGSADDEARLGIIIRSLKQQLGDSDGELTIDEWVRGMKTLAEELDDEAFDAEMAKWMAALAKNQRQMWRGVYASGRARQFVIAARASGATHALFIQPAHSEVVPLLELEAAVPLPSASVGRPTSAATMSVKPLGPKDVNRAQSANPSGLRPSKSTPLILADSADVCVEPPPAPAAAPLSRLTNRGTAQCMLARQRWFGRLPMRQVLFVSPARTVKETALHMVGKLEAAAALEFSGGGGEEHPLLRVCEKLGAQPTSSACATLFAQKTQLQLEKEGPDGGIYASAPPLRALLDGEDGEREFGLYAEAACDELTTALRALKHTAVGKRCGHATYLSVFGHAGYNHATAYAVATAAGMQAAQLDEMLNLELGDAEGVLVPLYGAGKGASVYKRPK